MQLSRRELGAVMAAAVPAASGGKAREPTIAAQYRQSSGFIAPTSPVSKAAVYFDMLEPVGRRWTSTIIAVHGGAHSGACYLATADGRPGWAPYLASRGYRVIVPDWPGIGRSGSIDPRYLDGEAVCAGLADVIARAGEPVTLLTHSMAGAFGWKLLEKYGNHISRVVAVAPAPPGNIQTAAKVVEEGDGYVVVQQPAGPFRVDLRFSSSPDRGWAERKLIGHGSRFPPSCKESYLASLLATPPLLVLERVNSSSRQLRVDDFRFFRGKRILLIIGSDDLDHNEATDGPVVAWLNGVGARAELLPLVRAGIVGNGHMMMLEDNSDVIASRIASWIG